MVVLTTKGGVPSAVVIRLTGAGSITGSARTGLRDVFDLACWVLFILGWLGATYALYQQVTTLGIVIEVFYALLFILLVMPKPQSKTS